jgi:hypothetical protein
MPSRLRTKTAGRSVARGAAKIGQPSPGSPDLREVLHDLLLHGGRGHGGRGPPGLAIAESLQDMGTGSLAPRRGAIAACRTGTAAPRPSTAIDGRSLTAVRRRRGLSPCRGKRPDRRDECADPHPEKPGATAAGAVCRSLPAAFAGGVPVSKWRGKVPGKPWHHRSCAEYFPRRFCGKSDNAEILACGAI